MWSFDYVLLGLCVVKSHHRLKAFFSAITIKKNLLEYFYCGGMFILVDFWILQILELDKRKYWFFHLRRSKTNFDAISFHSWLLFLRHLPESSLKWNNTYISYSQQADFAWFFNLCKWKIWKVYQRIRGKLGEPLFFQQNNIAFSFLGSFDRMKYVWRVRTYTKICAMLIFVICSVADLELNCHNLKICLFRSLIVK